MKQEEPEPYFGPYRVENILNITSRSDSSQDSEDDCTMIGNTIPLPLNSTSEGLIKHENDPISKDKPFIVTVSFIRTLSGLYIGNHQI